MHTAIAKLKRGLAMLLSMIMLMSALPASAFADDDAAPAETTAAAVEEAPVVSSTADEGAPVVSSTADEGAQSDETADPALPTSVTAAEETTGAESAPAPETSSAQDQNAASESGSAPEENAASEAAPVQFQESAPAPAPAPVDRELTVGKTVDEKLTAEKDSFTIRLTVERYSRLLLKLSGAVRVTMFNEQESEKKEAVYTVSKDATGEWAAFEQILSVPEATYFITVTALEKPQTDIGCPFTLVFENYIVPAAAPAPDAEQAETSAAAPAPGAEQTETPAAAPALSAEQEESPAAAEPSGEPAAEPQAEPASEPAPIEYSFSGENDSVMLLTLLTEHGVYTTALDDAEVTAGNEQAVELLSLIGDYIAVPAEHFNKLTLTVTTREGDRIEIFLHNPKTSAPVQQTIDAEMPADLPDTSMTLSGLLPEDAAVSVETMEAPRASDEGTVLLSVDITVDDGYEPDAPIRVTVSDPSFAEATSAGKEILVVHTAEDGTLESVEIVSVSGDTVVFMAEHFSQFTFLESAVEMLQSWTEDLFGIALYGFNLISPSYTEIESVPSLEEGLELVRAYQISCGSGISALLGKLNKLYFSLTHGGIEQNERESVAVYGIRDGELSGVLAENPDAETRIELGDAEGFVIVRDTGYRHKNIEQGGVVLNGMMPKTAEAVVTDVTEAYAQSAAQTAAENDESAAESAESAAESAESAAESAESAAENVEGAAENGDTPEAGEETAGESAVETPQEKVLAAYEITLRDGEAEYQPDAEHPIRVEIACDGIDASMTLELRHIKDDGTTEEIKDFTVENGKVCFDAPGFSVYVVVDHEDNTVVSPRVMFHFIADNAVEQIDGSSNVYYQGDPYHFKNKDNVLQTTQILSNGETLELIADPSNQTDPNQVVKYFYGWYIVNPYNYTGTTVAYEVGMAGGKLYYTWPAMPDAISFETAITITESNINAGDTVHWTLGGVSGSGAVDKEGNVHVFLAPIFERYNFVNFMLYAKNTQNLSINSMMTRKLIAKGSASSVEVKISDVRSNSTDPVHLVFTGWEYFDGTDWHQYQTVDYTGAEVISPGRDGVYLTVDLTDTESVDLYPIFVEARWVDFVSSSTGSGASYVSSRYLESWFSSPPTGYVAPQEEEPKNVISGFDVPTRPGYTFGGWYAFATTDSDTGEITNLSTGTNFSVSYIDIADKFTAHSETVSNMTAIPITDGSGSVVYNGTFTLPVSGQKLFEGDGSKLKFYDPLDRLTLYARWIPAESQVTVVYWTENAQDRGFTPSTNVEDTYSANRALILGTNQLNDLYEQKVAAGTRPFASGSTITFENLNQLGLLDTSNLTGAVPEGDEKFFEVVPTTTKIGAGQDDHGISRDIYPDASKVIDGDGRTVFNVYFDRITFKLVFHIGRDGYVKNAGQQKGSSYPNWDGNWIEYMYNDAAVSALQYTGKGQPSYYNTEGQQFSMTYIPTGNIYTSAYATNRSNVMGNYLPDPNDSNDANLYIIEAKYGAYIGDRWPSPTNPNFSFVNQTAVTGQNQEAKMKTLYIWTAYYNSLYAGIANARSTVGNKDGNNSDINGVYEYMSAELCANRAGTGLINDNHVHHMVAYFGEASNQKRYKQYHILIEAIDGTIYDPSDSACVPGADYPTSSYPLTTWSEQELEKIANSQPSAFTDITTGGRSYYEISSSPFPVISNLQPQFQLSWDMDGYDLIYSCYDPVQQNSSTVPGQKDYHIYFFYRPKQYTLTFMYTGGPITDTYYYTQSLENALACTAGGHDHSDPTMVGYTFKGWYTNESGAGEEFKFTGTPVHRMPSHNVVLYPRLDILQYMVKIDPNGGVIDHINYNLPADDKYYGNTANPWGVTGTGHNQSQATYFTADYGTPVGEYTIKREYIELSEKEKNPSDSLYYDPAAPGHTWYYYVNTQYSDPAIDGDWGLATDLRNAVYMDLSYDENAVQTDPSDPYYKYSGQLKNYWKYYYDVVEDNLGYYTGVQKLEFPAFLATYTSYPDHPYRTVSDAKYTFMGWYQEFDDGTVSSMPYNFNEPVMGPLKLVAKWRLDGGYYVQYNPIFLADDGHGGVTAVVGELNGQWTDPSNPSEQLYADQSLNHILRAPTNVTSGWIFRGWRVVRANGTTTHQGNTYFIWNPIQFNESNEPIYYQPGDNFTVDSALVTETSAYGGIIHMQAFYEREDNSTRRPDVTNLILDANEACGGYVNDPDSSHLPALSGPGRESINTTDHLDAQNRPTQILLGDFQSNIALHLYRYASTETFNNVPGTNFFSQEDGYLLVGFDEGSDPTVAYEAGAHDDGMRTGSPYVPTYPADSVAAVTRNEIGKTLYAVWEPMVYVTLVNTTDGDITVTLTGTTAETVRIVNMVTGKFERQEAGQTITVPAKSGTVNGSVKLVFPRVIAGTDTFTATAVNDHNGKVLSVSGEYPVGTVYGTGSEDVPYGYLATYTGTLVTDATGIGIVVTYTEEDAPPPRVFFDVNSNDAVWNEPLSPSTDYAYVTTNLYAIEKSKVENNNFAPADPTLSGKAFIGWTTNTDIAAHTDFSSTSPVTWGSTTITPETGSCVLDKVRSDYLFDFSQPLPPDDDLVLYAVWSDTVTVTFDMTYSGPDLHNWTGPVTTNVDGIEVFYRSSPTSSNVTYTLAKGDRVPMPSDPTANAAKPSWYFYRWLNGNSTTDAYRSVAQSDGNRNSMNENIFDFEQRITENKRLVTSWTDQPPQFFTFTVENHVLNGRAGDEFTYTIAVTGEKLNAKGSDRNPNPRWGSVTTKLKDGEQYTVRVKVTKITNWGGSYNVEIDVFDRSGAVIKSGMVLACQGYQTYTGYTSDYRYNLTITQDADPNYDTDVTLEDNVNIDTNGEETDRHQYYTFTSRCGTRSGYEPLNGYSSTMINNSRTIIFTNMGMFYASPTGVSLYTEPFLVMALSGLVILAAAFLFRRRRFEEPEG